MPKGEMPSSAGAGGQRQTRQVTAQVKPLAPGRLAGLFDDATLYPIQFAGPDHIDFVPMTTETYHRSTFLDRRIKPAVPEVFRAEAYRVERAFAASEAAGTGDLRLVFHSAYCCSTLLASALARLPRMLVLKEPVTLLQIALGIIPRSRLPMVRGLLSRGNSGADRVVVKASSACNVIGGDLLAEAPLVRALFLYSDLRSFLLAVLKDPNRAGRMRETLASPDPGPAEYEKLGVWWPEDEAPPDVVALDDARLAAWVWIGRLRAFARMRAIAGPDRISALDGARVASEPAEALAATAAALRLDNEPGEIDRLLSADLWHRDAKSPSVAFDKEARDRELARFAVIHQSAVASGLDFARMMIAAGRDATFAAPRAMSGLRF